MPSPRTPTFRRWPRRSGPSYVPAGCSSDGPTCPLSDSDLIRAAPAYFTLIRRGRADRLDDRPKLLGGAPSRRPTSASTAVDQFISVDLVRSAAALHRATRGGRTRSAGRLSYAAHTAVVFHAAPLHIGKRVAAATIAILVSDSLILSRRHHRHLFGITLRIFLAAAALRLSSALSKQPAPERPFRDSDRELPIYTIICALYREEKVVNKLVAAIRALDYPGIMAQTPQAFQQMTA